MLVSKIRPRISVYVQCNETIVSWLNQLWFLWSLDYCNWITSSYTNHCLNLFFVLKLCFVSPCCSMTLSALLISCLIYKIVASCSNQCAIRPPTKLLWLNILRKSHLLYKIFVFYNVKWYDSRYGKKQQGKMSPGL